MESMEDRTMKLSGLPPFPQPLEIANEQRLPHSHRTTATGHFYFAEIRTFELCTNRICSRSLEEMSWFRPLEMTLTGCDGQLEFNA
jgi:hypothetical protein